MLPWYKNIPKKVYLTEVGPRDGLQNEEKILATDVKVQMIDHLVKSGLNKIEVTAFVSPKWVPALADSAEVVRQLKKYNGVTYSALVPNLKGYDAAINAGIDEVSFVLSASQTQSKKNINATIEQAFTRYKEIANKAIQDGTKFRSYLSCCFGCPYEGNISVKTVVDLSKKLLDLGCYEISISDTIGIANPVQTSQVIRSLKEDIPVEKIALHMHDTRGQALANILAALQEGVFLFDSSISGLGGCPYAKGASGNVCTEDLVQMLQQMKIDTGVDIDVLCKTSKKMQKILKRNLPSKMLSIYTKACQ